MGWKRVPGTIAVWGWLLVAPAVGACAQTAAGNAAAVPETLRAVAAASGTAFAPDGQILRQIEDPSTGDLWLLVRDQRRPAGPGRLVLARQGVNTQRPIPAGPAEPSSAAARPVIHAGDALMVEQHTAVIDACLEAVALEAAVKGACFKARLKIGGKVVRVVAVSPGRASFAADNEVRP